MTEWKGCHETNTSHEIDHTVTGNMLGRKCGMPETTVPH